METIKEALLDTHAFLWAILAPERLSGRAKRIIVNPDIRLYMSAASLWEIILKSGRGKLAAPQDVVDSRIEELRLVPMPISFSHIRRLNQLTVFSDHKDPFDRLIVAQALSEGLPLVTADKKLNQYDNLSVIW